jgi:hypothetical protein
VKHGYLLLPLLVLTFALGGLFFACDDDDDDNNTNAPDDDDNNDDNDNDTSPADDDDDDTTPPDDDDDDSTPNCTTVVRGSLEWSTCDNGADISEYDSEAYVANLVLEGKDDWRMPTRAELQTLYDESFTQETECFLPVHIVEPFDLSCAWVWSGDIWEAYPTIGWVVGFSHGTVTIELRDLTEKVRCLAVRDVR